ncbi:hypothetical protein [Pelagicoccus sp. SDUM812003]|uniref:hypothetical protein n=1 Tax=Pelagicoccus sp. SDUM812003 TaxID=3041267 RepID=UPI00280E9A49|nr:hypothetical protein [Pelagicoccus sp. SDUM812003]MDQ8205272.1 hypothetical protein [Pelagicoccus sp. SDUM812003]
MELTLFQATLFFGLALLLMGGALLFKYGPVSAVARTFPRSSQAGVVLMIVAMTWTAWKVLHLGAADYGNFKQYILIGFGLLGLATFKYAPDFLSVRAASILYLFLANSLLDSAWMQYDKPMRLLLVAPTYLGIVFALYLAYAPFRLRDFLAWLFNRESRAKKLATALAIYGALLSGVAFAL